MNRVTRQLLQSELDSEPHAQFRYFLDYTTSDVVKAADFWNRGGGAWNERVARQLELRNFVRVLNAAIEGVTLASARILDEVGKGLGEARGLLQGDPSDVAENIAATAEEFSEEFGFARNLSRADEGWSMIPDFRRLKNRINHPDGSVDLDISEPEARSVLSVATWYSRQFLECVQPSPDAALWSNIPKSLLGEVPKDW